MGFVPGERCVLQGVKKLPPAHALVFDLKSGRSRLWRYWQLPELNASAAAGLGDETELLNELEALLEDAVRRQLVADVPMGVLLSGGVDSSLVMAMAVRARSRMVDRSPVAAARQYLDLYGEILQDARKVS
jgi:asparagine synthase (glutamine-hydrolysing)